jgi:hypothetical protein
MPSKGRIVHLKAYGFNKAFKIVAGDDEIEYWATDVLEMAEHKRETMGRYSWKIEEYHRGLKQFCGSNGAKQIMVYPKELAYCSHSGHFSDLKWRDSRLE